MISVVILTKNEEQDLPACLESVAWSDDIHVFDSFSTDNTVDYALRAGAHVTQRKFDNYAAQRNASLHEIQFKYAWVLILDADERVPDRLRLEMMRFIVSPPPGVSACRLRRRDYFNNTWLKHAQLSPYYIRLVQPNRVYYEREVNEVLKVEGNIVELSEPFDHHPFSKGMRHWLDKHNSYSSMEATLVLASRRGSVPFSVRRAFFCSDFNVRRFHQKELFYRLPLRPAIKFCIIYFLRRGFLDGRAGLTYALLQSFYEYMIVLKTREYFK
ncbi:MAG: glycosyltransferase family 2 protein [Pseudomonadota bacterium]